MASASSSLEVTTTTAFADSAQPITASDAGAALTHVTLEQGETASVQAEEQEDTGVVDEIYDSLPVSAHVSKPVKEDSAEVSAFACSCYLRSHSS